MARKQKSTTRFVIAEDILVRTRPSPIYVPLSALRFKKKIPPKPTPAKVRLHIFQKAAQIWKPAYQRRELKFMKQSPEESTTVRELLESMSARIGLGWAITEVHERGPGIWIKGSTIRYGTDRADSSLAELGWNANRITSDGLPLVWVTIHPVAV